MSSRMDLLEAIRDQGVVADAKELEPYCVGLGGHAIIHQLWRLQKAGQVTFRERRVGGFRRLADIRLARGAR